MSALRTPICDLFGTEYRVWLAGMGATAGEILHAIVADAERIVAEKFTRDRAGAASEAGGG
jgi:hypothetical protein